MARLVIGTEDGVWVVEGTPGAWTVRHDQLHGRAFGTVCASPHDPDVLFAGADGHGLFRSINGGGSWRPMNRGLENPHLRSLACHPTDAAIVYAGTEPAALYRSVDGGETWERLRGLSAADGSGAWNRPDGAVQTLAFDPHRAERLYIAGPAGGLLRSDDAGLHWLRAPGDLPSAMYDLCFDRRSRDVLYAATAGGLYGSRSAGQTWDLLLAGSVRSVALAAQPPYILLAAAAGRAGQAGSIVRSLDDGRTWEPAAAGLAGAQTDIVAQIALREGAAWAVERGGPVYCSPLTAAAPGTVLPLTWNRVSDELPPAFCLTATG